MSPRLHEVALHGQRADLFPVALVEIHGSEQSGFTREEGTRGERERVPPGAAAKASFIGPLLASW